MARKTMTLKDLEKAQVDIWKELVRQLEKKGSGSFVSTHEILGACLEEWDEVKDAVHRNKTHEVHDELKQLAVACMVGMVSIKLGTEW